MADETTGTGTGQTTPSDAAAQSETQTQTTGATGTPQTPPGTESTAALTEQERNRIAAEARREADAKAKSAAHDLKAAQAKLAEYEAAEQARKDAELTEIEKAQKTAAEATAARADAEARLAAAELGRLRADLIAADPAAAKLPAAYKALVTGADAESLAASLAETLKTFEADSAAIIAAATGKPPSLGTASQVPGQPTATPSATEWSPDNNTVEAWRKERERLGVGRLTI